jgi:hypothetical protein
MKFYLVILGFAMAFTTSAQEITGNWYWQDSNQKHQTELFLSYSSSSKDTLQGNYCSVFYDGDKIDCTEEKNSHSITFSKVSTHIYKGNFLSFSHQGSGILRLTYNPKEDSLQMEILSSDGVFYLPSTTTFFR